MKAFVAGATGAIGQPLVTGNVAFRMKDFGLLATSFYWRTRICRLSLSAGHMVSRQFGRQDSLRALRGVERPILPPSWK
jgi:hypothetical protein